MSGELFPEVEAEPRRVSLVRLSGEVARAIAPIGRVAVDGEVHRAVLRGTRWWFTLRDRNAQIAASMAAGRAKRYEPKDGERVRLVGRVQWVSDRGQLRFEAEAIAPVGEGAVAALIADARRRLAADGLLDRPRKPIPLLPRAVGVVCGAEAAVRADIESVVAARFPGYPLVWAEVTVSGPGAVEAITGALADLDGRDDVEVILLARGGGDATQLLPFSDEELCRAVCACGTPVVSAIGHDGDRPLCDEVADLRCGTPSIAAAHVVPDRAALQADLDRRLESVAVGLRNRVEHAAARLGRVDRAAALDACVAGAQRRLTVAGDRLALVHPARQLDAARRRLGQVDWPSPVAVRVSSARRALDASRRELDALSPARVLERGYAVVRAADGTVVRRSRDLAPGEVVDVELAEGRIGARVEEVQ